MEHTSTASTKAALCLLAALFACNVYRAAACDITPAEAWNYDRYVEPRWQESLAQFDLSNHVLNTFLMRTSTSALGRKEIALRLPSLFAGLLFYAAVWRICRRMLGQGWEFAAGVAVLTLNPLLVDAVGEARGYGIATAAWMWALDRILLYFESNDARKLNQAAFLLALSVAASLTFVVPVLGLAATTALAIRKPLARDLWLPMIVVLFLLLAIPLNRAQLSDFTAGAASLRQTVDELAALSFRAIAGPLGLLMVALRIAVLLLVTAGGVFALRRSTRNPLLVSVVGTTIIGLLFLLAAHAKLRARFPEEGAIYLVPVLTLLSLSLFRKARWVLLSAATVCSLIYAAGLSPRAFLDGRDFIGSRDAAKAIRADAQQRPVAVATSVELEPVMNYYRSRYRQGNWERIQRRPPQGGAQYYVLTSSDAGLVQRYGLHIIQKYPGMLLAAR